MLVDSRSFKTYKKVMLLSNANQNPWANLIAIILQEKDAERRGDESLTSDQHYSKQLPLPVPDTRTGIYGISTRAAAISLIDPSYCYSGNKLKCIAPRTKKHTQRGQ